MEETVGVGKIAACLSEHLRVCRPTQTFVTLGAIGGHAQIIGTHAPDGVRDELVNEVIACSDVTRLHVRRNGADRDGPNPFYDYFISCRHVHVSIAKESAARSILHSAAGSKLYGSGC